MKLEYDRKNPIDNELTVISETEVFLGREVDIHVCMKHGLLSFGTSIIPDLEIKPPYLKLKKIDVEGFIWYPFYNASHDGKVRLELDYNNMWRVITSGDTLSTFKEFEPAFDYYNEVLNEYNQKINQ